MQGFVYIHRKIVEWQWYGHLPTRTVFMHLLLIANHKDVLWRGITIKRGQHLTSLNNLSKSVGVSVRQCRTALNNLISTHELSIKTTNKYTVISINNYDQYQKNDKQIANERQTNDKQTTTNNNDKNDKNEKNIYTNISSLTDEVIKEVAVSYRVLPSDVKKKLVELRLYCESTGKSYKNYRSTLMNWIRRDLESGKIEGNILIQE